MDSVKLFKVMFMICSEENNGLPDDVIFIFDLTNTNFFRAYSSLMGEIVVIGSAINDVTGKTSRFGWGHVTAEVIGLSDFY